jgi:hypothetical protein
MKGHLNVVDAKLNSAGNVSTNAKAVRRSYAKTVVFSQWMEFFAAIVGV